MKFTSEILIEGKTARAAFDRLAPSYKKAHVTSVEGAKAAETRQRRIEKVIASLTSG